MRATNILGKSQTIKIGKEPVVLVPLSLWRKAEDFLEDQEALASKPYLHRIRKARADVAAGKVLFPFELGSMWREGEAMPRPYKEAR